MLIKNRERPGEAHPDWPYSTLLLLNLMILPEVVITKYLYGFLNNKKSLALRCLKSENINIYYQQFNLSKFVKTNSNRRTLLNVYKPILARLLKNLLSKQRNASDKKF